jgi:hypothetical protein
MVNSRGPKLSGPVRYFTLSRLSYSLPLPASQKQRGVGKYTGIKTKNQPNYCMQTGCKGNFTAFVKA